MNQIDKDDEPRPSTSGFPRVIIKRRKEELTLSSSDSYSSGSSGDFHQQISNLLIAYKEPRGVCLPGVSPLSETAVEILDDFIHGTDHNQERIRQGRERMAGDVRREPVGEDDECSSTDKALQFCKRRVLSPYLFLLGIIGLRPFNNGDAPNVCTLSLILNKLYIIIVILLLFTGYVLQYFTCFRRDRGFSYKAELSEVNPVIDVGDSDYPTDVYVWNDNDTYSSQELLVNLTIFGETGDTTEATTTIPSLDSKPRPLRNICDGQIFYVHILPSFLHFMAFLYMVGLYWFNVDEQLPNLLERVFVQSAQIHITCRSQKKLLRRLKLLIAFGCFWLLVSTMCLVFFITYHRISISFLPSTGLTLRRILGGVMGLSIFWQDAIQITVIVSYCVHCHFLSQYMNYIHARISQHSISLADCIKEIGEIDKLLRYINYDLATGLLPLLLLNGILFIGGFYYALGNRSELRIHDLICSSIVCLLLAILLALPLYQAARLSTTMQKVRELGHLVRMRPFGYQNYNVSNLDSFLLFVSTIQMDVRICRIPLSATNMSVTACSLIFFVCLWGYFQ